MRIINQAESTMRRIAAVVGMVLSAAAVPTPDELATLTSVCLSGLKVKRPDTLWCAAIDEIAHIVESEKECDDMAGDTLYCPIIPCKKTNECQTAINKMFIDHEPLFEADAVRICSCLGEPFGLRNDEYGFKKCIHSTTHESPWSNIFDPDINTYNYTFASCEQLETCSALRWYDATKWWDKIKSAPECSEYAECRILQNVALATECAKPNLNMRDAAGTICNKAKQKTGVCDKHMEAMLCIGDNGCDGAVASTPEGPPDKEVCAGLNSCSSTKTRQQCLRSDNSVWCPELSENKFQPLPFPNITRRSEKCANCEVDTPDKICCIDNNDAIRAIDSAVDCTGANDTLCINVECDTHIKCNTDYSEAYQHFLNESTRLLQEVCDCLGDDFSVIQFVGRPYCIHTKDYAVWNSREQVKNSVRNYLYLTCEQLARCEPPNALDDVLWFRSLPDSCSETVTCGIHKEVQEANICKSLTIFDKHGDQCSALQQAHFCEAESRAYLCSECSTGLDASSLTCWADRQCTTGVTKSACLAKGGHYCPDIYMTLEDLKLPVHESCLVCENNNPGALCCTQGGNSFVINDVTECYGNGSVLCGETTCTTDEPDCMTSSRSDHLYHESNICKCLGDGFDVFPDATGIPYCYRINPFQIWDSFVRTSDLDRQYNVTCDKLMKCSAESALGKAEWLDSFPLHCSTVVSCKKRRAEERMIAQKQMNYFDATVSPPVQCPTPTRDYVATVENNAIKCLNCPGEKFSDSVICLAPGEDAHQYCANGTRQECENDGRFFCANLFHDHSKTDSEVCAACPEAADPNNKVCASDHGDCTANSTESTCVGVFCPSVSRSSTCASCENNPNSKICCIKSGAQAANSVDSAKECTSTGDELCVNVRCPVDPVCSADYAVAFEVYAEQNKKDTIELCQCLGSEFVVVESRSRIYYCVHSTQYRKWNSFEINGDPTTRTYPYVTCEQLARCEPPSALDDVYYYKTVPPSCTATIDCAKGREGQEALLCKQTTFIDKKGSQCTLDQRDHFCDAEIRAHTCAECDGGLNATMKVCATGGRCVAGLEKSECQGGYYCPDIYAELSDLGIPAHESCLVCEKNNPNALCCTRDGKSFPVVSREECNGHGSLLCSDVSCVTESTPTECSIESSEAAALHLQHQQSVCGCLGLGYSVIYDQGTPYCYDDSTLKKWDDYSERELGNRTYSVSCEQLVECETLSALDKAEVTMSFTEPICSPYTACRIRRAREKKLATKLSNVFGGSKQCSSAQRDSYAGLETNALKCLSCPGTHNLTSKVCVSKTTWPASCEEAATEAECGDSGYFCATLYKDKFDSLSLCTACPGGLNPETNTCATPDGRCIVGSDEGSCSGVFCRAIFGAASNYNGLDHVLVGDSPSQNIGPFVLLAFAIIVVAVLVYAILTKRKQIEKEEALAQQNQ